MSVSYGRTLNLIVMDKKVRFRSIFTIIWRKKVYEQSHLIPSDFSTQFVQHFGIIFWVSSIIWGNYILFWGYKLCKGYRLECKSTRSDYEFIRLEYKFMRKHKI